MNVEYLVDLQGGISSEDFGSIEKHKFDNFYDAVDLFMREKLDSDKFGDFKMRSKVMTRFTIIEGRVHESLITRESVGV